MTLTLLHLRYQISLPIRALIIVAENFKDVAEACLAFFAVNLKFVFEIKVNNV